VVTANGDVVRASAEGHADLFWAIRGGSGNFGVVTSFVYRLHPVGPILGGQVVYPAERSREALQFYHEFASAAPDALSTLAFLGIDAAGQITFGITACWCGAHDEGERALRPLREFGPSLEDTIGVLDYGTLQRASDAAFPPDQQHYWKSRWLV